jgi:hypothetical protein
MFSYRDSDTRERYFLVLASVSAVAVVLIATYTTVFL